MENNFNNDYNENVHSYQSEEFPPTGGPSYTPPLDSNPGYAPHYTDAKPPKRGMAIASLVLGIISLITSLFAINIITGVIGIVLAGVFLSKKQREGRGMAIAGLVLNIISIAIFVLFVVVIVVFATQMMSADPAFTEFYYEMMEGMR